MMRGRRRSPFMSRRRRFRSYRGFRNGIMLS